MGRVVVHREGRAACPAHLVPPDQARSDRGASVNQVAICERSYASARDAVKFNELGDSFLASKRFDVRGATADGYAGLIEMYLRPMFGQRFVRDLTRADVEALKAALLESPPRSVVDARLARYVAAYGVTEERWRVRAARPVGRRTVSAVLALLSALFTYAIESRMIGYNPATGVKKRGAVRCIKVDPAYILTVEEARRLIAATSKHYQTLIRCAVETGMRQAELIGLQWGDIDLAGKLVYVRRQWKHGEFTELKTTNAQRVIPLTPGLVSDLRRWRLAAPKGELDLVFPNPVGRPICASNLTNRVFLPALRGRDSSGGN